ncbi:hypothetical protein RYZ27_08780 [Hyphomonas sp. FCG-A18]|jgi:hypothetical protein|uniref:hypothetical protein n=1 Tax=Hyphomonas sp. FCG-A18 TaxID=3080019 RepID=UPI002B298157|nr:hypothetical protein RYZ27_08780 [Hyphomonas sp. FCG-A18]
MKFFIINSFRMMVYAAYLAIIAGGIFLGYYNGFVEEVSSAELAVGIDGMPGRVLTLVAMSLLGWIAASVVGGLIVTLLDIRDDINDRLPDARRDD